MASHVAAHGCTAIILLYKGREMRENLNSPCYNYYILVFVHNFVILAIFYLSTAKSADPTDTGPLYGYDRHNIIIYSSEHHIYCQYIIRN